MKRRVAREYVLQLLFQYEFIHTDAGDLAAEFWKDKDEADDVREFAEGIFRGTVANVTAIDEIIMKTAENWVIDRMAAVDRNILRFACYELLYRNDIPPKVSINEAIEIAKKFSSLESASFINGILDKVARQHPKTPKK